MNKLQIDPLLLPFLQATDEEEAQLRLDGLIDLASPAIRRVISWSQDPEDAFQETVQRMVEKLWGFKENPAGNPLGDYFHYVKVVASHVAKGQLREKNWRRRSLVDALRHTLKDNPIFAVWENENRERLCGLTAWGSQPIVFINSLRLTDLLNHCHRFSEVVSPTQDPESMDHAELLTEIFTWVGHPVKYDDLVRLVCELRGVQDPAQVARTEEQEARPLIELLPDSGPRPDEIAEWGEFLQRLWSEIEQLPRLQRIAYLLNFTAGDGQLELFRNYGVVSIRGVGAALQLSDDEFARALPELPLSDEARRRIESITCYDERFAYLWRQLPLTDAIIAKMIGAERQKVINLRKAASDRLSRRLISQGIQRRL